MELIQFNATNLNHIKSIEIEFKNSLNFITGVNGSGKTSILSAIISLLSPNLEGLSSLRYDEISILIKYKNSKYRISSRKLENNRLTLQADHLKERFEFNLFDGDEYYAPQEDVRAKYYSNLISENFSNKTLSFLEDVATPMYLGLDRRYRGSVDLERRRFLYKASRRKKRNVFGSMLGDSLAQAVGLAEDKYRDVQLRTDRLRSEFVRDLLLALLSIPMPDQSAKIKVPTKEDRLLIEQATAAISEFPRVEGISNDDVRQRIEPALATMSKILKTIPERFDIAKSDFSSAPQREVVNALIQWSSLKPTLQQINSISELITTYNGRESDARHGINNYVKLVESFLIETSKTIGFDDRGALQVEFGNSRFGVEELSSGEAQIFVLLTHLSFNENVKEAGVFIIDEPELSLHLLWQEILVDNLLEANPNLQYILATHSPSIILDRTAQAIDISDFARQND